MPDGHACYFTGQTEPCPNDAEIERLQRRVGADTGTDLVAIRRRQFNSWEAAGHYLTNEDKGLSVLERLLNEIEWLRAQLNA